MLFKVQVESIRCLTGSPVLKLEESVMNAQSLWDASAHIPTAFRQDHDDFRAELSRATMESGPVGKAALRVARYCLPHFEMEERIVFPAFAALRDLAADNVRPEMAGLLPLISRFDVQHVGLTGQHESIVTAVEKLLQAAHKENNREIADFAYHLRSHENLENQVIYPMVRLIGNHVREKLKLH
jgi:hypothetical protein